MKIGTKRIFLIGLFLFLVSTAADAVTPVYVCVLTGNYYGVLVSANTEAIARISNSTVTENIEGLHQAGALVVANKVRQNKSIHTRARS